MPAILPCYVQVVHALAPIMQGLPGVIVTIDGHGGAGKTTLGRYLAWHFNVTLIETDLFLIPAQDYVIYLDDQINRIVERRVTAPLPVIVEGVAILQLMKRINRVPDFKIYVNSRRQSSSAAMTRRLDDYETEFLPFVTANIVIEVDH
ncbi:MAG: hypothetical protein ABI537_07870 [Casimicrobiaceae bacterium]